jgi:hypothetical protein
VYYWRIRFWDAGTGKPGDWSATQQFTSVQLFYLKFQKQPTSSLTCMTLTNQPIVRLEDADGNLRTSDSTTQVTLSILANPGATSLVGTSTITASSGVATFTGLQIPVPGESYTQQATATGYVSATTNPFTVDRCTLARAQPFYEGSP